MSGLDESLLTTVFQEEPAMLLGLVATLTARERQIAELVARGKSSAEIGVELGISRKTVMVHRDRILGKLHGRNAADVARVWFAAELCRNLVEEAVRTDREEAIVTL